MIFKLPGNPKAIELIKSVTDRSCPLDSIQPIRLEELNIRGKPKKLCAWCAVVEMLHGNQKYCSKDCSSSAEASFYPQKEESLRFLLMRQDWKCAHCLFDYRPFMEAIVEKDRKRYGGAFEFENLPWHYFKRLKDQVPPNKKPEVDHILAISKGGQSLGLDNHQAICYDCHKTKTKKDLSGKRTK